MRLHHLVRDPTSYAVVALSALLPFIGSAAWAAATSREYVVSQIGRAFKPVDLAIERGDTVQIVNDDGDLLHHIFLELDRFSFELRRSAPWQPNQHHISCVRQLHRALRHSPENEAPCTREVKRPCTHVIAEPKIAACDR